MAETITEQAKDTVAVLADEKSDSTNSNFRYMAYASRLQTPSELDIAISHMYEAHVVTSFRPVVNPRVVTAAYGLSWLYLAGDVGFESYKAYRRGPTPLEAAHFSEPTRIGMVSVKRAVFQSIASMALPAFTIHTAVKQSKRAFKNAANPRVKSWGPTFTGLAIVPVLPYLFDKPVEHVTDKVFEWIEERLVNQQEKGKTEL